MKLRLLCFSSLFLLLVPLCSSVLGVSPGSYEIDFEPGLKKVFTFNFINDEDVTLEIYASGDLTEHITLSTKKFKGGGSVNALVELPDSIEKPGRHRILVGGRQIADGVNGFGIVGNVRGSIFVNVPYPGQYAELLFTATDAKAGETVDFSLLITSRGTEAITTQNHLEIYDASGIKVATQILGVRTLGAGESTEIMHQLSTRGYKAGNYLAVAFVEYGEGQRVNATYRFRLGELRVAIKNYTRQFTKGKINKIDIDVESAWNDPIENIYANISIIGYPIGFLTPSIGLGGFERSTLSGYFDTSSILNESFEALATLHYAGTTTQERLYLSFSTPRNYKLYIYSGVGVLIIVIGLGIWILMGRRKKRGS